MRIKNLKPGFEKLTKAKARIIGHLIGDGCIFRTRTDYVIKYEVKDQELLDQFERDLTEVYGLPLYKGTNPSGKTGELIPLVRLRSKLAYEDLRSYCKYTSHEWNVPQKILSSIPEIRIEFLRALFDDEGTVVWIGKSPEVRLYSVNIVGITKVSEMLLEFNILTKIFPGYGEGRNVYGLIIKNTNVFKEKIGFSLRRKQNKLTSQVSMKT